MEGAVFVQTNAAHNEVIAFSRAADGSLAPAGTFATGGAGDDNAHLPSQGSVTLTRDRRHLLVTNVASNDVSVFAVNGGMLELTKTVPVGAAPRSIAEHDGLVFVLDHRRRRDPRVPPRRRRPCTDRRCEAHAVHARRCAGRLHARRPRADRDRAWRRQDLRLRRGEGRDARRGTHDRLARRDAVRVRDLARRHARRDRGVPRREGRGGGLELPGGRRRDHAGAPRASATAAARSAGP